MGANPKMTLHTNRRESLLDADFVQTTIQVKLNENSLYFFEKNSGVRIR